MNEMRKLIETVSSMYEEGPIENPETPEEILQELQTTYRRNFRGTRADIWEVIEGWAAVGYPAGGGDTEFAMFKKTDEGYLVTDGYYSDRADHLKISDPYLPAEPTLKDAVEASFPA